MLLVASSNGSVGMDAGWEVLASGGSALDAVEATIGPVESNPEDHTVGYGGYPNLAGFVELDASVMDGATGQAGAVGALRGHRHAFKVARAVMERLPHVLVVGEGASQLAAELGMEVETLLSLEAEEVWRAGIEGRGADDSLAAGMLSKVVDMVSDPDLAAGTVNVIAIDQAGQLVSGVSTSGWAWKYPGRLGDSPVIGAGNYADLPQGPGGPGGAATCTGWGELTIRAGTARTLVADLSAGASPEDAARRAARSLIDLAGRDGLSPADARVHLLAVAADGRHAAASTASDATYVFRSDGMASLDESPRIHVA